MKHLTASVRAPILVGARECVNTDYFRYGGMWGGRYPPLYNQSTEERINADADLVEVRYPRWADVTLTLGRGTEPPWSISFRAICGAQRPVTPPG